MVKPSEFLKHCLVTVPEPETTAAQTPFPAEKELASERGVAASAEFTPEADLPPDLAAEARRVTGMDAAELRTRVEEFFQPEGPLQYSAQYGGRPYEFRAQQQQMALAVTQALLKPENVCIEAPTGVGKSFAYLVPMILASRLSRKPLVVSTETIHLQEQLIDKDLPLLARLLGIELKAALAKGRANYLCLRRLSLMTGERRDEFLPLHSLAGEIDRIFRWSETSPDGNRETAEFRIENSAWSHVCCESGNCLRPKCKFARQCFYWKARLEWENADIIVANHALFFTDLKMQQDSDEQIAGLLPPYAAAVIDEAHTLEACAAEYLGLRINQAGLNGLLNKLYNGESGRGLLLKTGKSALELREQVEELREAGKRFFLLCGDYLSKAEEKVRRVLEPGLFPDLLTERLMRLRRLLGEYALEQEDADFQGELEAQLHRCDAYIDGFASFINMTVPDCVYWVEDDGRQIGLQAAPLNVPELLQRFLFERDFPVILTSATLTVNRRFDYFMERTGFTGGTSLRLDSPFDPDAVTLHVSRNMPEPTQYAEYDAALALEIRYYLELTGGKAFVLFTSYAQMRKCADVLAGFFQTRHIRLLLQGGELSRGAMLREFKSDVNSVIFGTDSFWTGVDVPGEALSNVILTKLPFAVPSHPLIAARSERIERDGGNAFFDYSLPEAVLKFRQGAGRLIRSRDDTGIIVVLDKRVVSKRYGRMFLDSLPDYRREYRD